jgi:hypothetical protein
LHLHEPSPKAWWRQSVPTPPTQYWLSNVIQLHRQELAELAPETTNFTSSMLLSANS